jgi:DNA-binding SARP family transcriptional activator
VLHIELLGEMRITVDGQLHPVPTSQKARQVLARLAEPGGNLARETLAETFWEGTSTSARVSLSTELKNLRRTLGSSSELLISTRSTVGLRQCEDLRIDIREFAEHFRREQYQEAVALWRGDFLQETSGEWADGRRNHYRRMAARAHERLSDEAEVSGDLATCCPMRSVDGSGSSVCSTQWATSLLPKQNLKHSPRATPAEATHRLLQS